MPGTIPWNGGHLAQLPLSTWLHFVKQNSDAEQLHPKCPLGNPLAHSHSPAVPRNLMSFSADMGQTCTCKPHTTSHYRRSSSSSREQSLVLFNSAAQMLPKALPQEASHTNIHTVRVFSPLLEQQWRESQECKVNKQSSSTLSSMEEWLIILSIQPKTSGFRPRVELQLFFSITVMNQ